MITKKIVEDQRRRERSPREKKSKKNKIFLKQKGHKEVNAEFRPFT